MPEYYGANDRSTLEGLHEVITQQRDKARLAYERHTPNTHGRRIVGGELNALNLVLRALERAINSGPTPKGVLALMEREAGLIAVIEGEKQKEPA